MAENQQTTGAHKLYYSVIEGSLRRKAKPEDNAEFVTKRTNKSGQEVEEYTAGSLSGIIDSIAVVSKEFNGKKVTNLEVLLKDVGENYLLQFPVESKYFASFAEKLPNVDYTQYVTISVYDWTPTGESKKKTGVSIKQAGQKVLSFFSKENPLPGVDPFPVGGADDDVKLWGIQRTKALKKLIEQEAVRLQDSKAPVAKAEEAAAPQPEDDLPF
jgi:hypothetical protein